MNETRYTLAAVAERAGVSIATVSRVLNGHNQGRQATRERVQRAVAELRYDPNALYRPFLNQGSPMVGFLIPANMAALGLNRSVYLTLVQAIREEADVRGFGLYVGTFDGTADSALVGDHVIRDRQIEGAVISRLRTEGQLATLRASGLPLVVLNRDLATTGAHVVTVDNRRAAAEAARHLLALGHRRLAVLGGPKDVYSAEERLKGYRDAVREAGLPDEVLVLVRTDLAEAEGRVAAEQLIDDRNRPTAILADKD